jgi:hypothetical protein
MTVGAAAGDARAAVVDDLSTSEAKQILETEVEPEARLMSDEWKAFIAVGQGSPRIIRFGIQGANMFAALFMSIPPRGSMQGSDARSLASFTTSVRNMPTSISTRSASDGLNASSRDRPPGGLDTGEKLSKPFGRASPPRFNYRLFSKPQQVVNCVEPARAGFSSNRP